MKTTRTWIRLWLLLTLVVVFVATAPVALAQSDDYDLDWWTVDGGGVTGRDSGTGYTLNGTIGQPDAATWTDNHYTLSGGFWTTGTTQYKLYLPIVLRNFSGPQGPHR